MLHLRVRNVSGLRDVSDYEWEAFVNDVLIAEGSVKKHLRADGWVELVRRIVENMESKPRSRARGIR